MTLKTLKPKANNLLTLDDEFLRYCELNHIEDVQKLARETFKKGFDILKYGDIPTIDVKTHTKIVNAEVRKIQTEVTQEMGTIKVVIPKNIQKAYKKTYIEKRTKSITSKSIQKTYKKRTESVWSKAYGKRTFQKAYKKRIKCVKLFILCVFYTLFVRILYARFYQCNHDILL